MGTKRFLVKEKMDHLVSIGERIREERTRLGLSQTAFAELGGVTKKTQMLYEGGTRAPDALYLFALGRAGVDIQYAITGVRSRDALSSEEQLLLERYRAADDKVRAAAIGALIAGAAPAKVRGEQIFHGSVGSVTKVEGNLDQRGLRISVGKKKK